MTSHRSQHRPLAALLLAGSILLLPATAGALTFSEEEFVCPIDNSISQRIVVNSYTVFDTRLDFRPVGAPMSPPPIAVCRSNGFVLYQEGFTEDQLVQLRAIVASDEYKTLRAENGDWFMAGYLAERMGMAPAETHWMYLYAAWADEDSNPARSQRYLSLAFERFVLAERANSAGSRDWWVARWMQIEIHRRLGRFEEADRLLEATDMTGAPDDFHPMIERQTQLVAAQDSSAQ